MRDPIESQGRALFYTSIRHAGDTTHSDSGILFEPCGSRRQFKKFNLTVSNVNADLSEFSD